MPVGTATFLDGGSSLATAFGTSSPYTLFPNLDVGVHTLTANYSGDLRNSASSSNTITITVTKATPTINWPAPAPITYGTALSGTQLDATISPNVSGFLSYTPPPGTVLSAGAGQTLSVTFMPIDTTHYTTATASVTINVNKATPKITWPTPAAITYGTALSATQLNATANTPGAFVYSPSAGTVLSAGNGQTLSVTFTPTDTTNYTPTTVTATINVNKATPTITWAAPPAITYGTPLSGAQLDATANVPGAFVYSPSAGTVLSAGNGQTLSVTFTPTDTNNLTIAPASTTINVNKATPTITWPAPTAIAFGSALSSAQLNAVANVPGVFVYSPPAGTVLPVGAGQTLSATFTPADTTNYNPAPASTTITVNPAALPPSPANLVVTKTLTRGGGNVSVQLAISNTGGADAANVTLTGVKVGATIAAPLPQTIGTIAAGASAQATVTVPDSVGAAGAASTLSVSGTYTGGSFNSNARVTLP
jgi:hypothetical protein